MSFCIKNAKYLKVGYGIEKLKNCETSYTHGINFVLKVLK